MEQEYGDMLAKLHQTIHLLHLQPSQNEQKEADRIAWGITLGDVFSSNKELRDVIEQQTQQELQ